MSVRVEKRCAKCAATFTKARCPKGCPTSKMRWQVISERRINGKRKRTSIGTFATSKEAEAARKQAEDNERRGMPVVASAMPLREWGESWLTARTRDYSPTTVSTTRSGFHRWLMPALGDVPLRDLTPVDFERLYDTMLTKVKPVTVRAYSRGWHSMFADAIAKGLLIRNPMQGAIAPKVPRTEPAILSLDDIPRVMRLMDDDRHGLVFRLLLVTGARRGEVLAMTWDDLDLDSEQPTFKIRRALTSSGAGLRVGDPKTDGSRRTVALDPETARQLRELRHQHRIETMSLGREAWLEAGTVLDKAGNPHHLDLVLRRDGGRALDPSRVTYWWGSFLRRHGFDHVKLHSLRHAWASVAITAGVPMKVVQAQLGHSNIATTLDIYSHVTERAQAEATATVMAAFGD